MKIHQISVFLENRAGQLAEITGLLAAEGIDLRAINVAETTDYGVIRLITDNEQRACEVLQRNSFVFSISDVQSVAVPDEPGGLSVLLKTLADSNIDVLYMYSVFGQKDGKASMIFRVADQQTFEAALKNAGIDIDSNVLGI